MARPSRTGGKTSARKTRKASAAKGRSPKARPQKAPKTDYGSKKASRTEPSNTDLQKQLERQARELEEARQQQAASFEALQIISSSAGALKPVFQAITKSAVDLCKARFGAVFKMEGELLHLVTDCNFGATQRRLLGAMYPMKPSRGHISGRAILAGSTVQIPDIYADEDYKSAEAKKAGFRSLLAAPLLQGRRAIGSIVIYRTEPGAFSAEQVALLKNFAAQAVIAIENARLFNETQQALARQAATTEILEVVNSSPGNLPPVFDTILEKATSLSNSAFGALAIYNGDDMHQVVAMRGMPPDFPDFLRSPVRLGPETGLGRLVRGESFVHIIDASDDEAYRTGNPVRRALVDIAGARTYLAVPVAKDGVLLGSFTIYRREVRSFEADVIALLQNFATQAAIAIQNARLFNETKEALEQQTATSEVLNVIASSPTRVEPVLKAIVKSACELCESFDAAVLLKDGDDLRFSMHHGPIPIGLEKWPLSRGWVAGRSFLDKAPIHLHDLRSTEGDQFPEGRQMSHQMGHRTVLCVPMLREGEAIGVIGLRRTEVRPFSDKQIALLQTFADQAVIAIQNVRLFNETKEALEQQTATSEVLEVISSSPGELDPVFQKMLENACRVCEANFGFMQLWNGEHFTSPAAYNVPAALAALRKNVPIRPHPLSGLYAAAQTRRVVHRPDVRESAAYRAGVSHVVEIADVGGARTLVIVPMLKEDQFIGSITMYRQEVRPFTDKQIALVENFTKQAVIAIENTRLLRELRERTDDLQESLQQQTATSEVLQVISSSPGELEPVFETMLENATRICGANFGTMYRYDGAFHLMASHNAPQALVDARMRTPVQLPPPGTGLGRLERTRQVVHIHDIKTEPGYAADHAYVEGSKLSGARTILLVPMLKDAHLAGSINIFRKEVHPFTDKQVELLGNFAKQAVIAIENARLLKELHQRTDDLSEALTYQTGSANILKVIAASPTDVGPVLNAIVESACELCEANDATVALKDGDDLVFKAQHGSIPIVWDRIPINRRMATGRAAIDGTPIHIRDLNGPEGEEFPDARQFARRTNVRSLLSVPLLREGNSIGVITLRRQEVNPFTDKQIALLQTFADQAVIAIENARLFNETKEALERQTATADVLKVISRSSVELGSVLHTLVQTVARLCRADQVYMFHLHHDLWHLVADCGLSAEARDFFRDNPFTPGRGSTSGRAALERRAVLIPDVLKDPEYTLSEGQEIARYRTTLGIPLLREDTLIGVYSLTRTRVESFTDKEIELATTFADQAVIAIENARLFDELRERQAELRVTFDNMGDGVAMFGADKQLVAWNRNLQEMLDLPDAFLTGRPSFAEFFRYLAARGEFGSSADLEAELSRSVEDTEREMRYERSRPDGRVIEVRRNPVPDGGFVLIYADITERKRAEEAIRLARDDAEKALRDLQTAQDRLVQTEKLASLGQLTAGIAHEIKNPLNFVNNFSGMSAELIGELRDVVTDLSIDPDTHANIKELTDMLSGNLEKIVQHGKRADAIVKSMLLHSGQSSGEHRLSDINALVDESLNRAYYGERAETRGFAVKLERLFDPDVGEVDLFPREISRALLNLISNGFYATTKRKEREGDDYEPVLLAATRNLGDRVEIRIRDNGSGIPAEVKEKMFDPFFTTKPPGEGTGLGLSITHDIIVKQHGGSIEVDTMPGEFTEVRLILARGGALLPERL